MFAYRLENILNVRKNIEYSIYLHYNFILTIESITFSHLFLLVFTNIIGCEKWQMIINRIYIRIAATI